jgi:hypothetical protein
MGARYPFYLLADSREGQHKEAEVTRTAPSSQPVHGNIRHGFVYERVPHITLKSIANNAEIDVIWEKWQDQAGTAAPREAEQVDRQQREIDVRERGRSRWQIPRGRSGSRVRRSQVVRFHQEAARRLVASAHRPAERDRCLDRGEGRV